MTTLHLKNLAARFDIHVEQFESMYGTYRPTIEIRFEHAMQWRRVCALQHALAAWIEVETPASESWSVVLDDRRGKAYVHLELDRGTPQEAERGMTFLRGLVARLSAASAPTPPPDAMLEEIARTKLRLDTLETRRADHLDFREVSVWAVRAALLAAYEAGRASASADR